MSQHLPTSPDTDQPEITILLPSLSAGGAVRTAIHLAGGFAAHGYRVDLVVIRDDEALAGEVPASVRIVRLEATRLRLSLPALVRYLHCARPQRLISVTTPVNVIAILAVRLARTATPLLVAEHNHLSSKAAAADQLARRLMPAIVRWTYPWADGIATVSQGVADDLAAITSIDADSMFVIYGPHAIDEMIRQSRLPLEDPWFAPDAPPVILGVGRLEPQKDFSNLLHAFRELRSRRTARLVILGEGAERPALEQLIADLNLSNDVRLPGFDPNPFRYMSRARMFVLSSRWEGLAGVLIQAMACGCPVVSTDCPSGPHEILLGGALGSLVPMGDPQRLADGMQREMELPQPVEPLRRRARDFSVNTAVDAYLNVMFPANHACGEKSAALRLPRRVDVLEPAIGRTNANGTTIGSDSLPGRRG